MSSAGWIRRRPWRSGAWITLPLLPLLACAGRDAASSRWAGTITDSAGVELITNPAAGTWTGAEAWTVEEVLSVADRDADPVYQFGRISGVDVDGDGNIYVADVLAQNVRVFDASGSYVRTIGRPGAGPGDLGTNVAGVFVVGNHVLVPDLSNRRVSRFRLDGTFISSQRLDMARGVPIRFDVTADGRLVAQRRLRIPADSAPRRGDAIVTLAAPGEQVDTLARLGLGQSVQITGGIPKIRQFTPDPVWDTGRDGRLVTGMTNAWRFEIHDPEGALKRIVSRPFKRKRVTAGDQQAVKDRLREMYRKQGVPPQASQAVIDAMEFAEYLPALASLTCGPRGSVWVQTLWTGDALAAHGATVSVADMGSRTWGVFGAEGHYLGTVTFPVDFRPLRVVGDRFYGIAKDDLDVQSVKVYRIVMD